MKTFNNLKFKVHPSGDGLQATMKFKNGYGVSVIQSEFSYGGDRGLWEVAVLDKNGLTYDTTVTDDVIGYLEEEEVTDIMRKVQQLVNFK